MANMHDCSSVSVVRRLGKVSVLERFHYTRQLRRYSGASGDMAAHNTRVADAPPAHHDILAVLWLLHRDDVVPRKRMLCNRLPCRSGHNSARRKFS